MVAAGNPSGEVGGKKARKKNEETSLQNCSWGPLRLHTKMGKCLLSAQDPGEKERNLADLQVFTRSLEKNNPPTPPRQGGGPAQLPWQWPHCEVVVVIGSAFGVGGDRGGGGTVLGCLPPPPVGASTIPPSWVVPTTGKPGADRWLWTGGGG